MPNGKWNYFLPFKMPKNVNWVFIFVADICVYLYNIFILLKFPHFFFLRERKS